jgi:putative transposase
MPDGQSEKLAAWNPRRLNGSGGNAVPLALLKRIGYHVSDMVRTIAVSLRPTPDQAEALLDTIDAFNAACNFVSDVAWETGTFRNYDLRKLCYYEVRARFGLTAQLAQHAIKKVADAYRVSKAKQAEFRPHGAITYDARVLRLLGVSNVSMAVRGGREKLRLSVGGYQADGLRDSTVGESDLVYLPEKRRFRLHLSVKFPDPPVGEPDGFLGVDLGIKNIAVDSEGTRHAGRKLRRYRKHCRRLRRRLQMRGTRGARRLLAKQRKKERRHATHVNHCISKQIVAAAAGTGRGVGVEDLTGIRDRATVRKADRAEHSGWAFAQLRAFLEYKCADKGIPCVAVDARNTSRTCPKCGCVDQRNRPSQAEFCCIQCGLSGHADLFAALEVARRATVSWPNCPAWKAPGKGSEVRQGKAAPL